MLTLDKPRVIEIGGGRINEILVAAGVLIYEGACCGRIYSSKLARALTVGAGAGATGDQFCGFALERVDNRAGAAGARRVRVFEWGRIVLDVAGVTGVSDERAGVGAVDDDTFLLDAGLTGYMSIGTILRWEVGTRCVVQLGLV